MSRELEGSFQLPQMSKLQPAARCPCHIACCPCLVAGRSTRRGAPDDRRRRSSTASHSPPTGVIYAVLTGQLRSFRVVLVLEQRVEPSRWRMACSEEGPVCENAGSSPSRQTVCLPELGQLSSVTHSLNPSNHAGKIRRDVSPRFRCRTAVRLRRIIRALTVAVGTTRAKHTANRVDFAFA